MTPTTSIKGFAAVALALVLSACNVDLQPEKTVPVLPQVSVAQVIQERFTEWDTFTGRLEAPQNVDLRPRVSGYIDIVAYEEGDIVRAGEPLFFIDNRSYKAQVRQFEAALKSAKARVALTRSEFNRAENLITRKAISTEALDNRRSALLEAEANLDAVQASLEIARLELSFTRVEAPITGRVSRALVTQGNYVSAGQSVLTHLVSTDKVYAYFDADEQTYLNYVKLDREGTRPSSRDHQNPVLMGLATDDNYPHQGYIDFVDNQVNPASGTIRGRAVFDNNDGQFIPGLFARIKLVGSAAYEGILIDDKAVGTDLNNKYVLVLNDANQVEYRAVTLGEKINGLRIIKQGLTAKDKIVVNGLQRVRPGSEVLPMEVAMTSAQTLQALQHTQRQIDASFSQAQIAKNTVTVAVVGG